MWIGTCQRQIVVPRWSPSLSDGTRSPRGNPWKALGDEIMGSPLGPIKCGTLAPPPLVPCIGGFRWRLIDEKSREPKQ